MLIQHPADTAATNDIGQYESRIQRQQYSVQCQDHNLVIWLTIKAPTARTLLSLAGSFSVYLYCTLSSQRDIFVTFNPPRTLSPHLEPPQTGGFLFYPATNAGLDSLKYLYHFFRFVFHLSLETFRSAIRDFCRR